MSSQAAMAEFYAKVNCNDEESEEDLHRRQLNEFAEEIEKLRKKLRVETLRNQTLKQRVDELIAENKEKDKIIANQKKEYDVYESLKNTFVGIDKVVEAKVKAEKRELKKARTSQLEDENNPADEVHFIGKFPSSVKKHPNHDAADDHYGNPRKRKTMEDRFNDLSLEDQSCSSRFRR